MGNGEHARIPAPSRAGLRMSLWPSPTHYRARTTSLFRVASDESTGRLESRPAVLHAGRRSCESRGVLPVGAMLARNASFGQLRNKSGRQGSTSRT